MDLRCVQSRVSVLVDFKNVCCVAKHDLPQVEILLFLGLHSRVGLLKSSSQSDEAFVDLLEPAFQVLSTEVLWICKRLKMLLGQLYLMLQCQQVVFVFMDQLVEVDLRHDVLELKSARCLVSSLCHVGVLDDLGRVAAEELDGQFVVVNVV